MREFQPQKTGTCVTQIEAAKHLDTFFWLLSQFGFFCYLCLCINYVSFFRRLKKLLNLFQMLHVYIVYTTLYIQMLYIYIYQKKKQEKTPTSFAIGEKICSVANCQKGQGKFLRIAVFQNHLCSSLSTVTDGYHLHVHQHSQYFLFVIYINSSTKHSCTHDWTIQMMFFACPLITVNCVITFFIPWVFFFLSLFIFQSYARSKHDCLITNQQRRGWWLFEGQSNEGIKLNDGNPCCHPLSLQHVHKGCSSVLSSHLSKAV